MIEVLTVPLESVSDDVEGASSDKRLLVLSLVKLTNRRSLEIYESGKCRRPVNAGKVVNRQLNHI